jgi:hypothetical protein
MTQGEYAEPPRSLRYSFIENDVVLDPGGLYFKNVNLAEQGFCYINVCLNCARREIRSRTQMPFKFPYNSLN